MADRILYGRGFQVETDQGPDAAVQVRGRLLRYLGTSQRGPGQLPFKPSGTPLGSRSPSPLVASVQSALEASMIRVLELGESIRN